MEPKQEKFSIGYVIATVLALVLIQSVFFAALLHKEVRQRSRTRQGETKCHDGWVGLH